MACTPNIRFRWNGTTQMHSNSAKRTEKKDAKPYASSISLRLKGKHSSRLYGNNHPDIPTHTHTAFKNTGEENRPYSYKTRLDGNSDNSSKDTSWPYTTLRMPFQAWTTKHLTTLWTNTQRMEKKAYSTSDTNIRWSRSLVGTDQTHTFTPRVGTARRQHHGSHVPRGIRQTRRME